MQVRLSPLDGIHIHTRTHTHTRTQTHRAHLAVREVLNKEGRARRVELDGELLAGAILAGKPDQVDDRLIVNLDTGGTNFELEPVTLQGANLFKQRLHGADDNAVRRVPTAVLYDAVRLACYCVGFTRPCWAVGEGGGRESLAYMIEEAFDAAAGTTDDIPSCM